MYFQMVNRVTDTTGNRQDKIANAARVLGKSKSRTKVFLAVCLGKQKIKCVSDLLLISKLPNKVRVLQEAKELTDEEIIEQLEKKKNNETCYKKIDFYCKNRQAIVNLARNPKKLKEYPTKITPQGSPSKIVVKNSGNIIRAKQITIDDIDSFSKVKSVRRTTIRKRSESEVKNLFKKILGETGKFQDWGGEKNDLFSTRLRFKQRRFSVAFGLKGKGASGKLTPKKMGKNGDQIQRLFLSSGNILLIQYVGEIDESIIDQMKIFAISKSVMENIPIFYGVIDGKDTERLFQVYS